MKRVIIGLMGVAIGGSISIGAQQPAPCAPSGGLTFICGVPNPEDLVLVPNTRWLIASGMAPGSGLHLVDTRAKTVRNLYAAGAPNTRADRTKFAGCPGPARPGTGGPARPEPPAGPERPPHRLRHQPRRPSVDRSVRAGRAVRGAFRNLGRVRAHAERPRSEQRRRVYAMARCSRPCSSCPASRSPTRSPAASPAPSTCGRPAPPRSGPWPAPSSRRTTASRHRQTTRSSLSCRRQRSASSRSRGATPASRFASRSWRSSAPTTCGGQAAIS